MFKKLVQVTVAASLVATPMIAATAEAQARRQDRHVTTTVQHHPEYNRQEDDHRPTAAEAVLMAQGRAL
ncbi:hypothetical protein [Sphingomonas sp. IC4-52]|uniref:hypothetical protein n=1 Tax=Sphingomonas sp. IC4-52 TaxID=2887202 RepID=UPI001D10926C|nr:hypothetical protein [Sphingomonas sp. IC4-52]MCC2978841.1 hypothetical protein [Sphingomonas sp. IC4-52]